MTPGADTPVARLPVELRREVVLAAALMVAPPLLLLDMPVCSMHDDARRRYVDWLLELRQNGTATISALDTPAEAEAVGARVRRIDHGRTGSA
jgi:ABC-2 type transport system ATP-binding protein